MSNLLGFLITYKINDINKDIVVFIKNSKYDKDIIVGFKGLFPKNIEYYYLDKNLQLNKHIVLENTKFRYAKISLSQRTIIDYDNLTIWISARKYKLVRQIFEEDTQEFSEINLIKKAINLSENF